MNLSWQQQATKQDILGVPYLAHTYHLQIAAGSVATTLVELAQPNPSDTAVLYLHGYTDYFFQKDLGTYFQSLKLGFFALDLQGYGRSIRSNSRPNWCETLEQYFDDLELALTEIKSKGYEKVLILAHSTGGLIASSYIASRFQVTKLPSQPELVGLILNSPFLALPFTLQKSQRLLLPIKWITQLFPFYSLRSKDISHYAKTLHKVFGGEWTYRLDWKPARGFPLSFKWLNNIIKAQQNLAEQRIAVPTLLCRSRICTRDSNTLEDIKQGDGVLDVENMQYAADKTFVNLTTELINKGFHDLYLSPLDVRNQYLKSIEEWLNEQGLLPCSASLNCHEKS